MKSIESVPSAGTLKPERLLQKSTERTQPWEAGNTEDPAMESSFSLLL